MARACWVSTHSDYSDAQWTALFARLASLGVREIFHDSNAGNEEIDAALIERVARLAAAHGIATHSWILVMLCNRSDIKASHRDWYCVNRDGVCCLDQPPHAAWCNFLCPTQPAARAWLASRFWALACIPGIAGVHLDYIRTAARAPKSKPDRSDLDYCYCSACLAAPAGGDPVRAVSQVVQLAADIVRTALGRALSAAVFPMHEEARAVVDQDWPAWPVDAIYTMSYPTFHAQPEAWIEHVAADARRVLPPHVRLHAGLYCPDVPVGAMRRHEHLALSGSADGVCFFIDDSLVERHAAELAPPAVERDRSRDR